MRARRLLSALVFPTSRCNGAGGTSVLPPDPRSQSAVVTSHDAIRRLAEMTPCPPESARPPLFLGSSLTRTHLSYRDLEVVALPGCVTQGSPAVTRRPGERCPHVPLRPRRTQDSEPCLPRTLFSGDVRLVPEPGGVLHEAHGHVLIAWIICKTEFKAQHCEGRFIASSHLPGN